MRRASLNHVYRLIWSESLAAYVAVPEIAGAHGKRSRAGAIMSATLALSFAAGAAAQNVVVAPGQTTTVGQAGNTVPVVNISAGNANGLSHNKFLDYNVGTKGLVLNNVAQGALVGETQLAGTIVANPNLTQSASVILNEVTSTNPSQLLGYTEVGGQKADVIIANPYGIACGGCGFINTTRVTLTTGTPTINGSSVGFNVNSGEISVTGKGLDGSNQNVIDLVARSVKLVDAQVNTSDLRVVAGASDWNYNTGVATAATGVGAAPAYFFDSSALGGMYAGKISIRVTEAGAGVRMLGDAAASAGDLQIDSAGKLLISGSLSAKNNLSITTSDNTANALILDSGSLSADQNLTITAQNGGVGLQGGLVYAADDLGINAASITDTSSVASLPNNNFRFAGGKLTATSIGAFTAGATNWGAGDQLNVTAGSIALASGNTIYSDGTAKLDAGAGLLALGGASVSADSDLSLLTTGAITVGSGAEQAIYSDTGTLLIKAGNGVTNSGKIGTGSSASLNMRVDGTLTNSGVINAGGAIDIADQSGVATALTDISNTGTLSADGQLQIRGGDIVNSGGIQGGGASSITASSLDNTGNVFATGTVSTPASLSLTLGTLTNNAAGVVQAQKDLTVATSAQLTNKGILFAGNDLTATGSPTLGAENTSTGYVQAGNALSFNLGSANLSNAGDMIADSVSITANDFTNTGLVQSATTSDYTLTGELDNSDTLYAGTALTVGAADFTNQTTGLVQGKNSVALNVTNQATNAGTLILSVDPAQNATLSTDKFNNSGLVQTAASLTLNAKGANFVNTGDFVAAKDLTLNVTDTALNNSGGFTAGDTLEIRGQQATLTVTNKTGAGMYAGSGSGDQLLINDSNTDIALVNETGATLYGESVSLKLKSLDNAGLVQSDTSSTYTVTEKLKNSGKLLADTTLSITAQDLDNIALAFIQAQTAATLNIAGTTDNAGVILSDTDLTVSLNTLNNTGVLRGTNNVNVNALGTTLANTGTIVAGDDLSINAVQGTLTINNSGDLIAGSGASDDIVIDDANSAITFNNTSTDSVVYGNNVTLKVAALGNAGLIQSAAQSDYVVVGDMNNEATGTLVAGTVMNLAAANFNNKALGLDAGFVQAKDKVNLNVSGVANNAGTMILAVNPTATDVVINTDNFSNSGLVQTSSGLTLNVGGATLTNTGTFVAGDSLTIQGAQSALTINNSGALIAGSQTGDQLVINDATTAITFNNLADGTLAGDDLLLNVAALSNAGVVVGGTADSTIAATGAITNTGVMSFGTTLGGGTGAISANTFSNSGANSVVQSQEKLQFDLGSSLSNEGKILSDDLTIHGSGAALTITNQGDGLIQGGTGDGGVLDLGSQTALTLSNLNNARLVANQLNIKAVALNNAGYILAGAAKDSGGIAGTNTITVDNALHDATLTNTGTILFGNSGGGEGVINANNLSNNSGGVVQSYNDLDLNVASALSNSGDLYADGELNINSSNGELVITNNNNGTIQGNDGTTVSGYVENFENLAGAKLYNLEGDLTLLDFNNQGLLMGSGANNFTVGSTFQNGGTLVLDSATIKTRVLETGSGSTLYSPGALNFLVGSDVSQGIVNNEGAILANDISFKQGGTQSASITNKIGGLVQSATDLRIGQYTGGTPSSNITVDNAGTLYGGGVFISSSANVDNKSTGKLQSNNSGEIRLGASSTFTNSGEVVLGNSNANSSNIITANDIVNNAGADILSSGSVDLNFANTFTNTGDVTANKQIRAVGTNGITSNMSNSGTIWAGTDLQVVGITGTTPGNITTGGLGTLTVKDNGVLRSSGTATIKAQTTELKNNGQILAAANLALTSNKLVMADTPNKIIGSSASTGGLTSITVRTDAFVNHGLLASGGGFDMQVLNLDNNYAQGAGVADRFYNDANGGILALGAVALTVSSGNFTNLGSIYGSNGVTITGVKNGGDTNTWQLYNANNGGNIGGVIESGSTISLLNETGNVTNNSRVSSVGNILVKATNFENGRAGSNPALPYTPIMVSNQSVEIDFSGSGKNNGGVISGANGVTLAKLGSGAAPTFTNDGLGIGASVGIFANGALTLTGINLVNAGAGTATGAGTVSGGTTPGAITAPTGNPNGTGTVDGNTGGPNNVVPNKSPAPAPIKVNQVGVTTGGTTATPVNPNAPTDSTSETTGTSNTGAGSTTPTTAVSTQSPKPTLTLADLNITLPTNPNGLFVPTQNPQSGYLIETNPAFVGLSFIDAIGSDNLVALLGLDPGKIELRLGDSAYENYLIRDQLIAKVNVAVLDGYGSQNDMISSMYASAADASKQMGLVWGEPLTPEQQGQLTSDIVWMVETDVGGVKALAPVVYLSAETQKAYASDGGIRVGSLTGNVESLTNSGNIVAKKSIDLVSVGDITNLSAGKISSNVTRLKTEAGSVLNEGAITGQYVQIDSAKDIGNTQGGTIKADKYLDLSAQRDINNSGGKLESGDYTSLRAGRDINNAGGTIKGATAVDIVAARDIDNSGGRIAGGAVSLEATGGALNNQGGNISGKKIDITQLKTLDTKGGTIDSQNIGLTSTGGGVDISGIKNPSERLAVSSKEDIVNKDNKIETNVLSLKSTGGSIVNDQGQLIGNKSVSLDAQKDIKNLSGQIKGGDVSLITREGSITSETLTHSEGGGRVVADQKASITATNNLKMDSAKDINILGSDVNAGKNAQIKAGNDVNIGTVTTTDVTTSSGKAGKRNTTNVTITENKNLGSSINVGGTLIVDAGQNITVTGSDITAEQAAIKAGKDINIVSAEDTTHTQVDSKTKKTIGSKSSSSTVDETHNVGSSIKTKGALITQSGGDTTIKGSNVDVGGDFYGKSGGNFNVVDAQDKSNVVNKSQESGFGVANSFYGSEKKLETITDSKSVGSSLKVGGSSAIKSGNDVNIIGSKIDIAGDSSIDAAKNVNILDGQDTHTEQSQYSMKGVFSGDNKVESKAKGRAESETTASSLTSKVEGKGKVANKADLSFSKTSTTTTSSDSVTSVGSSIKVGGSSLVKAGETIRLQGSEFESGGDAQFTSKDLVVTTGINTENSSTSTNSKKVGIFTENSAEASGTGKVRITPMSASASASGSASLKAESTVTTGYKKESDSKSSSKLTNTASSIKSGGDLNFDVENKASFTGSKVAAANNININAGELENLAAVDSESSSKSSSSKLAGLYIGANAGASASALAQTGPTNTGVQLNTHVAAGLAAGVRVAENNKSAGSGSTTNQVNSFTAGGDINRNVKGKITEQGTQFIAAGNINTKANEIEEQEIHDTNWSNNNDNSKDARIGIYAEVSRDHSMGVQQGLMTANEGAGMTNKKQSNTGGAGIQATYDSTSKETSTESKTAVTSSYRAGGAINTVTTGKQTYVGTQMAAGKGINLQGDEVNLLAAHDTETLAGKTNDASASLRINIAEKSVEASADYGKQKSTSTSSQAIVSTLQSGTGGVNIKTRGDTNLEGTQILGGGGVKIKSTEGNVNLLAAESTETESGSGMNVGFDMSVGKKKKKEQHFVGASGGFNQMDAAKTTNTGVSIITDKGSNVDLQAKDAVTMEGASIKSGKNITIAAEKVNLLENVDTEKSKAAGLQVDARGVQQTEKKQKGSTGGPPESMFGQLGATADFALVDKEKANTTNLDSAGSVTITTKKLTNQEADITRGGIIYAEQTAKIDKTETKNVDVDLSLNVEMDSRAREKAKERASDRAAKKKYEEDLRLYNQQNPPGGTPGNTTNTPPGTTPSSTPNSPTNTTNTTNKPSPPTAPTLTPPSQFVTLHTTQGPEDGLDLENTNKKPSLNTPTTTALPGTAAPATPAPSVPKGIAVAPVKTIVSMPAMPKGAEVKLKNKDGTPAPSWVTIDPLTGVVGGTPPADFKGKVEIMVQVPQIDGSIKAVPASLEVK